MKTRTGNFGKGIIPPDLNLWIEEGELKYDTENRSLTKETSDFVVNNEDFFRSLIQRKARKFITLLPVAPNQEALWFLYRMDPKNISYNVSVAGKIRGPFNTSLFKKAIAQLSGRHIMLRSVFADLNSRESSVFQIVFDHLDPYIEEIEARTGAHNIDEIIYDRYRIPFDLVTGPLFKTFIVHGKESEYFLINVHHSVCDAWSLKIFLNELFEIYNLLLNGKDNVMPLPLIDYNKYTFMHEEFLKSEAGVKQLNYWTNLLKDKDWPLILPYDFKRPEIQTFNGSTHHFKVTGQLAASLTDLASALKTTPNVIFYSAYELMLSKLSQQKQFYIGMPVSGRTKEEYQNIFGYVINILPVDCTLEEGAKLSGIIAQNKAKMALLIENQDTPFPRIVESVSPRRDPSRSVIFQVLYNFMNARILGPVLDLWKPQSEDYKKFGKLELSSYPLDSQEGQFDLTLEILYNINEFDCVFKYNTDLFKPDSVRKFEETFRGILNMLQTDQDQIPDWLTKKTSAASEREIIIKATGTFTTEPMEPFLNFWMDKLNYRSRIDFVGFNQVFQQLLNSESEFNKNKNGFNIALIRPEDIVKAQIDKRSTDKIPEYFEELIKALSFASGTNPKGKYLIVFCPPSDSIKKNQELNSILNDWELKILDHFRKAANLYFISSSETLLQYSVEDYYEPLGEEHGNIPYKEEFYISVATLLARKFNSFYRTPVKAIAVDCDNTLWKGIVGEDGYLGIKIGRTEQAIQKFLIGQYNDGVLICLSSKNNENDVFEVFDKNEEMLLKREHIAFHRINWLPKSQNLISLSKEINIGIDSFVLIDDSSAECDEVRSNLPQVLTIQKPEIDFKADFLRNSWIFDKLKVTEEDKIRTLRYREESVRAKYRTTVSSFSDFIEGLQIGTDIDPFLENDIPRISQLTFRTNQFNITTIRRDESEIKQLSASPDYDCIQVRVADRFGDYGLTGIIIANKKDGYVVDSFLLSCRILGKGVEHKLVRYLGQKAQENGSGNLVIPFKKTAKNTPAEMFLDQNFSKYKKVSGDYAEYIIPVEKARNFVFSPAQATVEVQESEAGSAKEDKSAETDFKSRNDFYYQISAKYLLLANIKNELKKETSTPAFHDILSDRTGSGQTVAIVSTVWKEFLGKGDINISDNFFDIGGHSILIPQIVIALESRHNIKIKIVDLFQYPTIKELANYIDSKRIMPYVKKEEVKKIRKFRSADIAIIGMAGKFPGAENLEEFWRTIESGREEVILYTNEELENKGIDKSLLSNVNYVPASPSLTSADKFDSYFFGFTPKEADYMDPQHRLFLEACYEAIENAGYRNENTKQLIGVFGGCGMNNYLVKNLVNYQDTPASLGELLTTIYNNSDYMTTRVSYKLNLKGPSIDIQTACSTSLVAVHIACQSLISRECDIALSGGAVVNIPHNEGYLFEHGSISSPDGHCRPFDKDANGTIFGEGVGVVVLKRLEDAVNDHDYIWAVIKGTAINNDGSQKVGYMAPGIQGQSRVIISALEKAEVNPESIGYIEAHGTGTKMGDPIEFSSLTTAFRQFTRKTNFCALGSVKGNIGHLDAAAGIAGLIKTVLLLKNRKLPPLTNFKEPNPELDIEESPFYFNTSLRDWTIADGSPRRAGVSAFGIGGTNAHCILEEAPEMVRVKSGKRFHLLPLSAKSSKGLLKQKENLIRYLRESKESVEDIAFTLQKGRDTFNHRMILVCDKMDCNIVADRNDYSFDIAGEAKLREPKIAFMFTGQGSQYIGMGKDLYNDFDLFRNIIDTAREILLDYDMDILNYIKNEPDDAMIEEINQTRIAQPVLFSIQYATARLLEEFGIHPNALIGHSIGELTAACIAGVFSFQDGLKIVAERGRIMQEQKPGAMLAVRLPFETLIPQLIGRTEISLINAPGLCVVSGDFNEIRNLEEKLKSEMPDVFTSRLKTSHAFHSYLIEPAVKKFTDNISTYKFNEPSLPLISNTTGRWADGKQIQDPVYWGRHIRSKVDFASGINELIKDENVFLLEIGPGTTLTALLAEFPKGKNILATNTIRHPKDKINDTNHFLKAVGKIWVSGIPINWDRYYHDEIRGRVPLPTYPFQKTKHWLEPRKITGLFEIREKSVATKQESGIIPEEEIINELKDQYHERPSLENQYESPVSEPEKRIAAIWEELLGIKGVGITDDFFQLGGHSLLAAQVINRINEEFESGITISSFFNNSTVKSLVEHGKLVLRATGSEEKKEQLDYSSHLPLSLSQERLWIINQIDNNNPAYNISFTYKLTGKLNLKIFEKSLEILFARHKVLKCFIRTETGIPVAYINQNVDLNITKLDFSDVKDPDLENRIQDLLEKTSRESFEIENGPLYTIYLIKVGSECTLFHFTVHHLVFDGWSWGIFIRELKEIYDSLITGREVSLDPLKIDYFEYSKSTREENVREKFKESLEFWTKNLDGISGHLNFPPDFERKEISSGRGERVALDLGEDISRQLRNIAMRENVTLYMLLISAFGILLNRYSGDSDICIGSPTANRPGSNLEKLIGLFINSVVMRLKFDQESSFLNLLKDVKKISIDAMSYQDLPFEQLVETLNPERIVNMNPVFQVMFALQNAPRPPLDLEGIRSERFFHQKGVSPLDISFYAWEEKRSIFGEIEFSTDIFKRSTIEAFKENFIWLLKDIIAEPGKAIRDYSIISGFEKSRLSSFNNTAVSFDNRKVNELFEAIAVKFPDKTALENTSGKLSYSELDRQSNQFASYLLKKGFTSGKIAAISMNRSANLIVAVMGILKAGGCYLPLDPAFPDERLFYMIEDSGAGFLITEKSFRKRFENIKINKIEYDTELQEISIQKLSKIRVTADKDSLAYLMYTSGSTGKPKGVKVPHIAVSNFVSSMFKVPGLTPHDKILAVTTLSFDISVLEIFLPLSYGATVFLAGNDQLSDGEALIRIITDDNITVLQATPATWALLIASGWKGKKELKALCGGEALQASLAKELLTRVGSLWNMYGPTETTVWSTCYQITDYNRILVGKPIDNTIIRILFNDEEQPVGAVGEVCIGGMGVTKGYHNREKLNIEKFVDRNGETIYRTGDLGRFLDDGNIELFGRNDNQLKYHGFRIEPGEIEFQLSQIDGIIEAVVKLERNNELDDRLVGYLHVNDSFDLNREEIVSVIGNKIPAYMIPSLFIPMKEFPRTLNGKIDRKALIFDISKMMDSGVEEDRELTETEKIVTRLWEETLHIRNIKKDVSFFDIGGNSLLAISLMNKIKERFEFALNFNTLINNPSIDKLAVLVDKHSTIPATAIDLIHLTRNENLPLTVNQKRLWLISKLQPDVPSYIITFSYRLEGTLDRDVFQRSLEILFSRHHTVFSEFHEIDGEPYCNIVPSPVGFTLFDITSLPDIEKDKKVEEIINIDSAKIFDLEKGPLFRLTLINTGREEHYFHISIHHIIFDGWSWPLFVKDLSEIYNSKIEGRDITLPEIEFHQYDFAEWENQAHNLSDINASKEFWKENLKGASSKLNFPYDFQPKVLASGLGKYEPVTLPKELTNRLRGISKAEGASLFATLLSVYGFQMHLYSGENDLNIGIPIAFRPHSKLENIFGMFVNTIIVRLRYSGELTFRDLVKFAGKTVLDAIAHQNLTFEQIVEIVNPERSSNTNPLFQIGFVWQSNLNIPLKLDKIKSKRITPTQRPSPFNITLYMWEEGDQIEGELEYSADLLKTDTAVLLKNNYVHLLNTLTQNPDVPVSSLQIASEDELKFINEINNTGSDYPKNKSIAELFEAIVHLYPEKTAVSYKENSISYAELNSRANQLARTLRKIGITRNAPVGLLAEKSSDIVTGILGILKSGGCYVPIDPDYPEQRIRYMLSDSGCKVVLTQDKFMNRPGGGVMMLSLNKPETFDSDGSDLISDNTSSDQAYIMYTSGTTGKPKGSIIRQYGVVRLVRNTNYINISSEDKILLTGAIVFDASTFEIWGALLNGGTLYIVDKEVILDARTLGRELQKNGISILWLTAPLFTQLAEESSEIFSGLKYLLSGGDVLSPVHIKKVRHDNPSLTIINGYGPTENTTFSTTYQIEKDFEYNIPIGKPISNSFAFIFHKNMKYLPVGAVGELYVGGDGLSSGYLNREDLNKTSFIDDPYNPGNKLYRTGDYARWLPDGNIEFHGRIDNQIKIRGFRVELGEIESIISEIDGIIETVLKPVKVSEGDLRLAAFLNVSDSFNMDKRDIDRHLRKMFPAYMIPSSYKLMNGFPKTINGKIDKEALIVDSFDSTVSEVPDTEKLSETEKKVYSIMSEVLKIKDISVNDNFFDIGGNSLLAMSVHSRLQTTFNIDLELRSFFDSPRIRDLAEVIDVRTSKKSSVTDTGKTKKPATKITEGEI